MSKSSATLDQASHVLTLISQRVPDAETLQEFIRRNVEVIFEADPSRFAFHRLRRLVAESVIEKVGDAPVLPPDYCYQDMTRVLRRAAQNGMAIEPGFSNAASVHHLPAILDNQLYSLLGITKLCDTEHWLKYMQWLGFRESGVKELFAYAETMRAGSLLGLMVAALNYQGLRGEGLVPVAYDNDQGVRHLELWPVQSWIRDRSVNPATDYRAVALVHRRIPGF